jgi:ABC-type multidrug transport system fused ATPase/permease subunit
MILTVKSKTLQRLMSTAKPEKTSLIWGFIFLILSSGAGLTYPQLVRWMIDNVVQPKKLEYLLPTVGVLFLAFVIQGIFGSLRYYLFTLSGERIVLRLRKNLYEKILSQEVAFFDYWRTGDLMSRLSSDCATLQNTVSVNISQGLRNLGQVFGGFAFMFYTSWKLSALMFVLVPPIALGAFYFGRKIRKFSKQFQESLAEASIVAEETISGLRTVKSFVQETAESDRYGKTLEQSLAAAKSRTKSIADFMTLALISGFGSVCFVLWYGGREVILSNLSIGDLTQFLLYLMIVAIGVGSLGSLWGDMMAGVGASQRVFEILERDSLEKTDGLPLNQISQSIDFNNIHFSYPSRTDHEVLKGISFSVKIGEAVAFVGPSGSGKTTLGYLLSRFYDPSAGEILIDGKKISEYNLKSLREQIGIVSQEPILISDTIEENIRYARRDATDQEVHDAARAANAFDFILSFPDGFKTRVGEKGIQLSGGQKQRVAIARALLKDPKILILDEATSNLDTASEHLVQEALHRLMKDRTTLIIAHRLATIKDANRIFVLDHGVISQQGRHEDLIRQTDQIYYQLVQRQFET